MTDATGRTAARRTPTPSVGPAGAVGLAGSARRAATSRLAVLFAALLTVAVAGVVPAGAAGRPVDGADVRWVMPTGHTDPSVTRADLIRSGVLARDFAAPTVRWGPGHRGVDLRTSGGSPVIAPQGGTVTFVGVVVDRPLVVISHADGLRSTLEPVASELSTGEVVDRGAVLGSLAADATTHCAPDTCLHWGVRRGEEYVDPLALVVAREPVILLPLGRS